MAELNQKADISWEIVLIYRSNPLHLILYISVLCVLQNCTFSSYFLFVIFKKKLSLLIAKPV